MAKPTLLYASPFPPQQSGISAYSAALVRGLAAHFDVTLLTDDYAITDVGIALDFPRVRHGRDRVDLGRFDHRLYNVGNQPYFHGFIYEHALAHPGSVILHDVVLYYLVVGYYRDRPEFYGKVFELEGIEGIERIKAQRKAGRELLHYEHADRLPFNRELLASSERILVHSEHARERVTAAMNGRAGRVHTIPQPALAGAPAPSTSRDALLARHGIPSGARLVVSLGFVAPTKMNHVVCDAVARVRAETGANLWYVMVGDGGYVASRLGPGIVQTGYVGDVEFADWIAHADLIVNLRDRSMGETSAAVLAALGAGRPCVVSDIGSFAELPDDVVRKVRNASAESELTALLGDWVTGRRPIAAVDATAMEYVERRHGVTAVAQRVFELLTSDASKGGSS
jgi:glycosyltransferase involved in cell wall biosynthesis